MGEDTPFGVAKPVGMRISVLRCSYAATALLALGLASCQGNLGSGTGLTIPQTQSFGQPASQGQNGGTQSRQRALDGAVSMNADLSEIPLPTIGGFSVTIALNTPGPSQSPSAKSSATSAAGKALRRSPAASPSPAPSASDSPAPAPSGSPSPGPSGSASPVASGKPTSKPTPKPKIVTKTTIYPDDAPAAPTPEPSGDVQTFYKRGPIVRGLLQPSADVSIYGLSAVHFTIPKEEETAGRGFTVAFFELDRKHHDKMLASDTAAKLSSDVVASTGNSGAIAMKKGQSYVVVLYGDEQPSTPGPVPSGYPQPGTNPFVTPVPPGYPQQGQPGYPQSQPGAPYPYATQTPFGSYPTQTPHY